MFLYTIVAGQPSYLTSFLSLDARNTACAAAGYPPSVITTSTGGEIFFLPVEQVIDTSYQHSMSWLKWKVKLVIKSNSFVSHFRSYCLEPLEDLVSGRTEACYSPRCFHERRNRTMLDRILAPQMTSCFPFHCYRQTQGFMLWQLSVQLPQLVHEWETVGYAPGVKQK